MTSNKMCEIRMLLERAIREGWDEEAIDNLTLQSLYLENEVSDDRPSSVQVERVDRIPFDHLPEDYPCSVWPTNSYPSSHWLESGGEGLVPRAAEIIIHRIACQGEEHVLYAIMEAAAHVWFILGGKDIEWVKDAQKMEGHFVNQIALSPVLRGALRTACQQKGWLLLGMY
jgi:hypothetical protein